MREILFRGKLKSTGEWSYGNLAVKDCVCIITPDETVIGKYGQVDPETVGQYTGVKDKNGRMIFEGDIIHYDTLGPYSGPEYYIPHVGPVIFSDLCCFLPLTYCVRDTLEVVGNIYDNPKMCKEV